MAQKLIHLRPYVQVLVVQLPICTVAVRTAGCTVAEMYSCSCRDVQLQLPDVQLLKLIHPS
eukprot:354125-Chlamydomonas_euryale.AAC.4